MPKIDETQLVLIKAWDSYSPKMLTLTTKGWYDGADNRSRLNKYPSDSRKSARKPLQEQRTRPNSCVLSAWQPFQHEALLPGLQRLRLPVRHASTVAQRGHGPSCTRLGACAFAIVSSSSLSCCWFYQHSCSAICRASSSRIESTPRVPMQTPSLLPQTC